MIQTYELQVPGIPKSLNRVGSRGSHFAWHREKKAWEGNLWIAIQAQRVRKSRYVGATAVLHPPTRHKRDEGNYRTMLEKALGDALQLAQVIEDDDSDHYSFGRLEFGDVQKPGLTVVTLSCELL